MFHSWDLSEAFELGLHKKPVVAIKELVSSWFQFGYTIGAMGEPISPSAWTGVLGSKSLA